jgi:predicted glycosyltransferase
MNILIDIGHPAHVHYFRNLIYELGKTNDIIVTTKNIGMVIKLLQYYNIEYICLGDKGTSVFSKATKQVLFTSQIARLIKKHNIQIAMGVSVSVAQAAKVVGIFSLYFDDDDLKASPFTAITGTPLASTVLSPDVLKFEQTKNAVYYPGYHELAYLHPRVFQPNPAVLSKYGVENTDKYFILRFNAFKAHHDLREGGMNLFQKLKLVELLTNYGKVYITSEAQLDKEFEQYKLPINPEDMHHFLYYAQMLVSDSQTMSSEAAVLGTPSFRCNTFVGRISYLEEEEKRYGLTFGYLPYQFEWMVEKIKEVLHVPVVKKDWQERRLRMLDDKIDVTAFWTWFTLNYPGSLNVWREQRIDFNEFK